MLEFVTDYSIKKTTQKPNVNLCQLVHVDIPSSTQVVQELSKQVGCVKCPLISI